MYKNIPCNRRKISTKANVKEKTKHKRENKVVLTYIHTSRGKRHVAMWQRLMSSPPNLRAPQQNRCVSCLSLAFMACTVSVLISLSFSLFKCDTTTPPSLPRCMWLMSRIPLKPAKFWKQITPYLESDFTSEQTS